MKKILLALAVIVAMVGIAKASDPTFDIGYSSFAVQAIQITSGTAVQINSRPPGFTYSVGRYRLINTHPGWKIWVGDVNVSTDNTTGSIGELLDVSPNARSESDWSLGKGGYKNPNIVPIYAKAADSTNVQYLPRLSVIWWGY